MGLKARAMTKEPLALYKRCFPNIHSAQPSSPSQDKEELECSSVWAQARKIEANFGLNGKGL